MPAAAIAACLALVLACGSGWPPSGSSRIWAVGMPGRRTRKPSEMVKTVGGQRLFALPADLEPGEFVCSTKTGRYDVDTLSPVSRPDAKMVKTDECTNLGVPIYTLNRDGGTRRGFWGVSSTKAVRVYVKTGPDTYLRLKGE